MHKVLSSLTPFCYLCNSFPHKLHIIPPSFLLISYLFCCMKMFFNVIELFLWSDRNAFVYETTRDTNTILQGKHIENETTEKKRNSKVLICQQQQQQYRSRG